MLHLDHVFFILSSVDGHLGCFHILATVDSAATNTGIRESFCIMIFSGYMTSSGIAGCMIVFYGTYIQFSIVDVSIDILTDNARGLPFLHTLPNISCLYIFLTMVILISVR